ncbi:AAA family ATPase [Nocardioides sp.]|uniref:AAA family ATPase n=1 Tax=Nocardioides sp. TaxID=35761 RepID=UPI002622ACA8|nr:AAA family ATPase [Nocardioides sp.]
MTDDDPLITGLVRAVEADPDNAPVRLHLAELLVAAGRGTEAVAHLAVLLQGQPDDARAGALMAAALGGTAASPVTATESVAARSERDEVDEYEVEYDWHQAESDLGPILPPMFATSTAEESEVSAYDVESAGLTLADVGGMSEVKKRLNAAFLAPLRNEKLRTMYRKSLRGGLMLYGPPGCGKTYIARALAGEMGARFLAVSLADILDMYIGNSEKNVHELFEVARASAPCVLFLDEVDAIGHKRSSLTSDGMRSAVNQLLLELDGVQAKNDGVYVLAATNAPWDVDPALRRPGRFDRTLLVLPPDQEARETIWRLHLVDRPVAGIDVNRLAKRSEGYTGADIAYVCEAAAENALMQAAESGDLHLIGQAEVEAALDDVRPSGGPWFETARNVVMFANDDGTYDELGAYLRKRRRL